MMPLGLGISHEQQPNHPALLDGASPKEKPTSVCVFVYPQSVICREVCCPITEGVPFPRALRNQFEQ